MYLDGEGRGRLGDGVRCAEAQRGCWGTVQSRQFRARLEARVTGLAARCYLEEEIRGLLELEGLL